MSKHFTTTNADVRRAYVQAKRHAERLRRERERREAPEQSLHDLKLWLAQANAA